MSLMLNRKVLTKAYILLYFVLCLCLSPWSDLNYSITTKQPTCLQRWAKRKTSFLVPDIKLYSIPCRPRIRTTSITMFFQQTLLLTLTTLTLTLAVAIPAPAPAPVAESLNEPRQVLTKTLLCPLLGTPLCDAECQLLKQIGGQCAYDGWVFWSVNRTYPEICMFCPLLELVLTLWFARTCYCYDGTPVLLWAESDWPDDESLNLSRGWKWRQRLEEIWVYAGFGGRRGQFYKRSEGGVR